MNTATLKDGFEAVLGGIAPTSIYIGYIMHVDGGRGGAKS